MIQKSFLSWSGGKDSSLCLYKAKESGVNIKVLLTTVSEKYQRISMHGVHRTLLEQQAAATGIPLQVVPLPESPDMDLYEKIMSGAYQQLKNDGFTRGVFGDIFLDDLKQYREQQLGKEGFDCLFPLWKMDSKMLIQEFLSLRFKAIIVCVNNRFLDKRFCGRLLDESFINDLPGDVDVCGENGEYHSFVFDGPIFSNPVSFKKGEIIERHYPSPVSEKEKDTIPQPSPSTFYFCDLLPAG